MTANPTADHPALRGAGAATRLIVAASVGNALEFYEIPVYGYFAVTISKVFSPRPMKPSRSWSRSALSAFHF